MVAGVKELLLQRTARHLCITKQARIVSSDAVSRTLIRRICDAIRQEPYSTHFARVHNFEAAIAYALSPQICGRTDTTTDV